MKKITTAAVALGSAALLAGAAACASTTIKPASAPSSSPGSFSQPSSPSPSSSSLTGPVGTSYKVTDADGDVYDVTLQKVIDPAQGSDQFNQPENGKHFVAAVFRITGVSGTASDDANSDAALIGANQQVYQPDFDSIAGYTDFNAGDFNLTPGQAEIGAVTFQVPTGVKAANVQWTIGLNSSTATWTVTTTKTSTITEPAPTVTVTEQGNNQADMTCIKALASDIENWISLSGGNPADWSGGQALIPAGWWDARCPMYTP